MMWIEGRECKSVHGQSSTRSRYSMRFGYAVRVCTTEVTCFSLRIQNCMTATVESTVDWVIAAHLISATASICFPATFASGRYCSDLLVTVIDCGRPTFPCLLNVPSEFPVCGTVGTVCALVILHRLSIRSFLTSCFSFWNILTSFFVCSWFRFCCVFLQ